ncbi:carboxypeptidase-like regulatory domain-containing protein [Bremerella sp. P1]|uniref:carboxypeptidase-like regulatory domain-containing protein n=1 Tax=Bremerella sp. P1 TaxID=3026424 RepID=UPI0023679E07|nr:carboxypeptidase-like regulatory domain-containing protein [Bremerella sp. P1]WDI43322.1 carboxypeptidase-like regulatory domain-containing protein [Bremerella sp. P1]
MKRLFFFIMLLAATVAGCQEAQTGLKGVKGNVTLDGAPAPEGVQVRFTEVGGDYSFTTRTSADGTYEYLPPEFAPLKRGNYHVAVLPPGGKTVTDETGLSVEEKVKGAPTNYGKYSVPSKSGITAELGDSVVNLDIQVET